MFLNTITFFNEHTNCVSVSPEMYYVWNEGIGFSGNPNNVQLLFNEYQTVKTFANRFALENNASEEVICAIHTESIYFYRALIIQMIQDKKPETTVINRIKEIEQFQFIIDAKEYLSKNDNNEELLFLSSDYAIDDYYQYCRKLATPHSFKDRLRIIYRKFKRMTNKVK